LELPFEKTVCRYWKQKLYELRSLEQTQELRIPEGMPDVGRVISAWGQVVLRGKEWRDRGLGVNGGVMMWVLYQPEGDAGLQRLESWIPFQERIDMPPSPEDGTIRIQTVLRSADARNVSSRKLMLRCGIGLLVQALVPAQAEIGVPGEMPEDVELLRNRYPMMLVRETGEKTFMVEEELELPGSVSPIDRLVYFQMEPELVDQKVIGSRAIFRGVGNLHMLYWNQEEKLCVYDFQVPFAQYTELDRDYEDEANVSNLLCVTSLELDVGEDGILHLRCAMVSQYTVQDRSVLDLVEDAYSPCRDVTITSEALTLPAILDSSFHTMDLSGKLTGGEGTMVDVSFQPGLPRISRTDSGIQAGAEGRFHALTQDKSGKINAQEDRAEEKYQQNSHVTTDTVCFSWRKGAVTSRREGSDWRVDTQMVLDLSSISSHSMNVVTAIELGPEREPEEERPSVIIRSKGKNERLWDIAKRCGSTVGAITRINGLEGEPEEDTLLLIPVV